MGTRRVPHTRWGLLHPNPSGIWWGGGGDGSGIGGRGWGWVLQSPSPPVPICITKPIHIPNDILLHIGSPTIHTQVRIHLSRTWMYGNLDLCTSSIKICLFPPVREASQYTIVSSIPSGRSIPGLQHPRLLTLVKPNIS